MSGLDRALPGMLRWKATTKWMRAPNFLLAGLEVENWRRWCFEGSR
jgi:hypothetical protein